MLRVALHLLKAINEKRYHKETSRGELPGILLWMVQILVRVTPTPVVHTSWILINIRGKFIQPNQRIPLFSLNSIKQTLSPLKHNFIQFQINKKKMDETTKMIRRLHNAFKLSGYNIRK